MRIPPESQRSRHNGRILFSGIAMIREEGSIAGLSIEIRSRIIGVEREMVE
jgi:hypothetical protein